MHLDWLHQTVLFWCWNLYRQEEQGEAAGTGEDLRHLNAYNRRPRATQSPNFYSSDYNFVVVLQRTPKTSKLLDRKN